MFDFEGLPYDVQRRVVEAMDGGTRKSLKASSRGMRELATHEIDVDLATWASSVIRTNDTFVDPAVKRISRYYKEASCHDDVNTTVVEEVMETCDDAASFVAFVRDSTLDVLAHLDIDPVGDMRHCTNVLYWMMRCGTRIPKRMGSGLHVTFLCATSMNRVVHMIVTYGKPAGYGRARMIELRGVMDDDTKMCRSDVEITINFNHGRYGMHVLAMLLYAWPRPLKKHGTASLRFFPLGANTRSAMHDAYEAIVLRFFETCLVDL